MENTSSRDVLGKNLWKLVEADARPDGKPSIRGWAMRRGLDVRLIDRLVKGKHAVTLDNLEKIAEACNLKPWHLLLEDFEPGTEVDVPISKEDRAMLRKLRKLLGE